MNRKEFLQSLIGATAAISTSALGASRDPDDLRGAMDSVRQATTGKLVSLADEPIDQVRVGIIGLGNRGSTLLEMFEWLVANDHARIVALSDLRPERVDAARATLEGWQDEAATAYAGSPDGWQQLARRDDVDLLLIATPWALHTPMALYGMNHGKHVACEVPIAYTLEDCWALVATAERTGRHCIMIENCCYNGEELFVLNMIQEGVFGDLTHAEGAYLHDLRKHLLDETYYQDQWRIRHHEKRDGNFYTTHGLGPISFYLNIGRGDTFDHLTSMSSRERNLSETAARVGSPYTRIRCGDINNTLIRTALGKTILLQFDVHTGRPYSRINKVVGTKAVHDGYPSRLYVDEPELSFSGHRWLDEAEYDGYWARYTHPMIRKLGAISQSFRQGHGGMDFVMIYRLIRCLNQGIPLDIDVYDSALWSAVTPLSELSVAHQSQPVPIPDFTAGAWRTERPLEIMREV